MSSIHAEMSSWRRHLKECRERNEKLCISCKVHQAEADKHLCYDCELNESEWSEGTP